LITQSSAHHNNPLFGSKIMKKIVYGWHFSTGKCGFGDGRKIVAGVTHKIDGDPKCCEHGLHASVRAIDALQYTHGAMVSRVCLSGKMSHEDDKIAAQERTYLWVADASIVLHEFACDVAEAALLLSGVKDQRCWDAIEAKHAWLRGEIDDATLQSAARPPVWAAAAAASDAAWAAAWAAAATASAATRAAAWAAARAATSTGAWAAARAEQNVTLTERLLSLAPTGFVDPEK
jgi:hypothetical protein